MTDKSNKLINYCNEKFYCYMQFMCHRVPFFKHRTNDEIKINCARVSLLYDLCKIFSPQIVLVILMKHVFNLKRRSSYR